MKTRNVKIGLVQMSMEGNCSKNVAKAIRLVEKAASKGAKIVCLPELFNTEYFPQQKKSDAKKLAEGIPGETTKTMQKLAKELGIALVVPMFEKSRNKYYNTVVVLNEKGKVLGKYRKMHIPHDPLFYEKNYFSDGNLGYRVFRTKFARIAPLICFDQWFPEAARVATIKGAEIIFYPTAIGWVIGSKEKDDWLSAWVTAQRGHAIANSVHIAAVNRIGTEKKNQVLGQLLCERPFRENNCKSRIQRGSCCCRNRPLKQQKDKGKLGLLQEQEA